MDAECTRYHLLDTAMMDFDWRRVGQRLLDSEQNITDIGRDQPDEQNRRETMLMMWHGQRGKAATYRVLARTFRQKQYGRIAEMVEEMVGESSNGVPPPPTGLKADNVKTKSMTISWQPPHDVNGIIRGYHVSYTLHGESEYVHDVVGDTTSTELTNLKPHTEYTIRVRARTVDFGDYSTPITATTLEDGEDAQQDRSSPPLQKEFDRETESSQPSKPLPVVDGLPSIPLLMSFPAREGNINIIESIGANHFNFGIFLLNDDNGTKVQALDHLNVENFTTAIFRTWLQGTGRRPITWSTLVTTLRYVDLNLLADQIEDTLQPNTQPQTSLQPQLEQPVLPSYKGEDILQGMSSPPPQQQSDRDPDWSQRSKQPLPSGGRPAANGLPSLPLLMSFPARGGNINIIQRIGTNYSTFGIFLLNDDNGTKVEALKSEYCLNVTTVIFRTWLQGGGRRPITWSTLVTTFRDVNQNHLAHQIEDILQPNTQPQTALQPQLEQTVLPSYKGEDILQGMSSPPPQQQSDRDPDWSQRSKQPLPSGGRPAANGEDAQQDRSSPPLQKEFDRETESSQPSKPLPVVDGPPSLPLLMSFPARGGNINIIQRIGTSYSTFGIFLLNDDNGTKVDALEYEHHLNPESITMAIFRTWLQGSGRRPITWSTLVTALRYASLHALADQIEDTLQPNSQPQTSLQPQLEQPVLPSYKGEDILQGMSSPPPQQQSDRDHDWIKQPLPSGGRPAGEDAQQDRLSPPLQKEFDRETESSQPSKPPPVVDGPPSLPLLMSFPARGGTINIIQRIGTNYFIFGVFLLNDDNGTKVQALKYEHQLNVENITTVIFRTWLQGTGRRPITWSTLVATLRDVNLNHLADQIEDILQPNPQPQTALQPQLEQPVLPSYKGEDILQGMSSPPPQQQSDRDPDWSQRSKQPLPSGGRPAGEDAQQDRSSPPLQKEFNRETESSQPSKPLPVVDGLPSIPLLMSFPAREGNINIIERICTDHCIFGLFLLNDDNGTKVLALEYEYHLNVVNFTTAIFRTWLQGGGRRPITWSTLVTTLRYVNLNLLADQIEDILQPNTQPQTALQPQLEQTVLPSYKGEDILQGMSSPPPQQQSDRDPDWSQRSKQPLPSGGWPAANGVQQPIQQPLQQPIHVDLSVLQPQWVISQDQPESLPQPEVPVIKGMLHPMHQHSQPVLQPQPEQSVLSAFKAAKIPPANEVEEGMGHLLDPEDVDALFGIVKSAKAKWRDIGRELGFTLKEMDNIVAKKGISQDQDYFQELLDLWLNWAPLEKSFPCTEDLLEALRHIGQHRLALKLEQCDDFMGKELIKRSKCISSSS